MGSVFLMMIWYCTKKLITVLSCYFLQPGCVNTTEIDIKKACRMNKPMKSTKHLQLGLAGGRISPSVSEADLTSPVETLKHDIDLLKTRVDRCNFKVSKAAES